MSRSRCINCGYDVSGTREGAPCPECGAPARDEREVIDHRARGERRWTFALQIGAMAVFAVLFLWVALAVMYS